MPEAAAGVVTVPPTVVTETPEFKAALKAERERLETNIRESNQTHLAKRETEIEAAVIARMNGNRQPQPTNQKDYFESWGERYGLPADAGRELIEGVVGHIQGKVIPDALAPITNSQKRQEIRNQRSELRGSNAKLAVLDDKFHAEATKMVEALRPELIGPDSYAKALQMVIGSHIEELQAEPKAAVEGAPEIVPGVEPSGSAPTVKKKVALNAEQKRFIDERGITEDDFVTMMRERAQALEAKGYTKAQVRGRLGANLGSIDF